MLIFLSTYLVQSLLDPHMVTLESVVQRLGKVIPADQPQTWGLKAVRVTAQPVSKNKGNKWFFESIFFMIDSFQILVHSLQHKPFVQKRGISHFVGHLRSPQKFSISQYNQQEFLLVWQHIPVNASTQEGDRRVTMFKASLGLC